MAFRSQPAGLTADDLFYQQVMGTQFVYDETGAVVELWQLEHRLVVEAQQIQRENYFNGKKYPEPILSALFPTLAPSEDPCPELTALRRLFAEAGEEKRPSKGAREISARIVVPRAERGGAAPRQWGRRRPSRVRTPPPASARQ